MSTGVAWQGCASPALARSLCALTQLAESAVQAEVDAQLLVCCLDCVADDEACDIAVRCAGACLARYWAGAAVLPTSQGRTAARTHTVRPIALAVRF